MVAGGETKKARKHTHNKEGDTADDAAAGFVRRQLRDRLDRVLSGKRQLMIAGEERTLSVSGTVRPIDIGPDNRVSSRYIFDPNIYYDGEGASRKFTRQGWVSRAVNKVWPF